MSRSLAAISLVHSVTEKPQGDDYYISPKNERPVYYGYATKYRFGFASVTQCSHCKNVGLYEDCHIVNPCRHCGGVVSKIGAGKWVEEIVSSPPWWRPWEDRKIISAGYWLVLLNKAQQ